MTAIDGTTPMRVGSLYVRLMLAALVPLVLGLGAAYAIAVTTFDRVLEARVADQATHAAEVLARSQLPLTPELLHRVSELERSSFTILGNVAGEAPPSLPPAVARALAALPEPRPAHAVVPFELDGTPSIAVLAPLAVPGAARPATLLAVASLADARAAARRTATGLALATLAAGLLLVLLLHYRIRAITRPLAELSRFAATIAGGGRDARLPLAGDDELAALAAALNDMTGRIGDYERQLADNSRLSALGEMAARIAHEVRNPLTGLKMQLQLLAERVAAGDRALVQSLLDEIRRLELVVDSSLTLGRDRPAQLCATDLGALAAEIVALHLPSLHHRAIEVATELGPLPAVAADRGLVAQALHNLIVNAADALPGGGRIRVRLSREAEPTRVVLSVADSGPGLPQAVMMPTAGSAGSSKPYGLGLGLAVCRAVAAAHGGELGLVAHSDLGGAELRLELPLADGVA